MTPVQTQVISNLGVQTDRVLNWFGNIDTKRTLNMMSNWFVCSPWKPYEEILMMQDADFLDFNFQTPIAPISEDKNTIYESSFRTGF